MKLLGIDPGLNTGVAYFVDGELRDLTTIKPWDMETELTLREPDYLFFEDSRMQGMFRMLGARQVGETDAWCRMLVALCERCDIDSIGVSPKQKGRKLNAAEFRELTGWTGQTNQHERDAVMVAWPYRNSSKDNA